MEQAGGHRGRHSSAGRGPPGGGGAKGCGTTVRVLILKLTLVPLFLLAVTLVARRWGPRVAGLMAGLPLVTGPILGFIVAEQGAAFGVATAQAALAGVAAAVSFAVVYARSALRAGWAGALASALLAWAAVALALQVLPAGTLPAAGVALAALMLGRQLRPLVAVAPVARTAAWAEVLPRMAAGAALTLAVTWLAAPVGPRWSGVLAVFPLLSTVVAADTHRRHGGAYAAALLSAMVDAFWAFAVFCVALVLLLDRVAAVPAFVAAVALALAAQAMVVMRRR